MAGSDENVFEMDGRMFKALPIEWRLEKVHGLSRGECGAGELTEVLGGKILGEVAEEGRNWCFSVFDGEVFLAAKFLQKSEGWGVSFLEQGFPTALVRERGVVKCAQ